MGRRRKRRKIIRKTIRRLPTIFICPYCSKQSLRINIKRIGASDEAIAEAVCGECGFCAKYKVPAIMQPVDAYGKLIDLYDAFEGDIGDLINKGACLEESMVYGEK